MLVEQARQLYDWVVVDLPTVFSRTSLMAISECERAFLISTAELPSLHLTRKALTMVDQLGFPRDRFHVLVNRVSRRDSMGLGTHGKAVRLQGACAPAERLFFAASRGDAGPASGRRGRLGEGHRDRRHAAGRKHYAERKGAERVSLKPALQSA